MIRADGAGVVEIYDYHRGELGELLGTEEVRAGANQSVRVPVGIAPFNDVIAQIKIDGEVVAEQRYFVNEDS